MCLAIYTFPLGIDGFFYLLFFDYFRYHPFILSAAALVSGKTV
jgi:hypothetical protein